MVIKINVLIDNIVVLDIVEDKGIDFNSMSKIFKDSIKNKIPYITGVKKDL